MLDMVYYIALRYFFNKHKCSFNLNAKRYTIFISIYCHFLLSIISIKLYLCSIYRKRVKSISRLTKHLNACKGHHYLKLPHKPLQHKSYNKKDILGGNWEDEDDLLGKMVTTAIVNSIFEILIEDTP